ncbi:hypothetical protein GCM10009067_34720 [Haloarcula sebkhae]|uniref:Uncharacterized protein n=1 Tax=Haloarcula sebkhae TaxID=932660 RepID=A0A830EVR0_9EURY|nr:hypothetical protein GCM10009067_34720 [Haloarcula sebkhae]
MPDPELDQPADGQPTRQREASHSGGYPDGPIDTDQTCVSCGASIPASQRKCRFCHEHGLDATTESGAARSEQTLRGVVHFLVESGTFYGAVAMGGAAASLLSANDAEPAVDASTLIYDLDEAPARQLAEQWPSLPEAVQVSSEEGGRILRAARDRTGWHGQGATAHQQQPSTRLYDQRGKGIRDASRLTEFLDDADDAVWLVPAMALTESTGEAAADRQVSSVPTTQELDCQTCGRATDHRFKTNESVPDETWKGQPIWECQVCGAARYGPSRSGQFPP